MFSDSGSAGIRDLAGQPFGHPRFQRDDSAKQRLIGVQQVALMMADERAGVQSSLQCIQTGSTLHPRARSQEKAKSLNKGSYCDS